MALLEKGVVPWHKPWAGGFNAPRNLVSGKEYRGVNVFMLASMGYENPYWLSFKQVKDLGGNVRRGEKATPAIFWKRHSIAEENGEETTVKQVLVLRYYNVFNVSQCEGIETPATEQPERKHEPIAEAEAVIANMPKRPEIRNGLGRAYYSPREDYIGMPSPERFDSPEYYYDTLFHELTHSTGHESRLARKGVCGDELNSFGSTPYAKEELCAEMGAAFLCGHVGIAERTVDNSAAYIGGWLSRLKDDPKLVVHAAAQAQKAVDFILGKQFSETAE